MPTEQRRKKKKPETMADVSDDDEDWYDTQADAADAADDDSNRYDSWEAFWERTVRDNEQAVRDAGGDPAKVPGPQNLPTGRHGDVLKNGAPADHGKMVLGMRRQDDRAAGVRAVPRDHEGTRRQGGVR